MKKLIFILFVLFIVAGLYTWTTNDADTETDTLRAEQISEGVDDTVEPDEDDGD